jgi:lysophospholipase L1-like esterase
MKRILIFGDSNSWGYVPGSGDRFGPDVRWPRAMASALGLECEVIEECLCSRTTVFEDPHAPGRSGIVALPMLLESHAPLDLVIIALGCNDLQPHYSASAYHAAKGAGRLVELAQKFAGYHGQEKAPGVLLVAPSLVSESANHYDPEVMAGAEAKSKEMARHYRAKAKELGCHFLAAAPHAQPSAVDGVHLDEKGHLALARAVAKEVAQILGEETAG